MREKISTFLPSFPQFIFCNRFEQHVRHKLKIYARKIKYDIVFARYSKRLLSVQTKKEKDFIMVKMEISDLYVGLRITF